jgi:hypothetical protein
MDAMKKAQIASVAPTEELISSIDYSEGGNTQGESQN